MTDRRLEPGIIAAAVLLAYGPSLFSPPPPIDQGFWAANPLLRLPWAGFLKALFSRRYFLLTGEATYQPLVTFLHYLTEGIPLAFHALVVGAHALNAWLLCVLARRLGLGEKTSLLAGCLFAAFPPATEAVAVPSFAGHVFGLTFTLACVLSWLRAVEGKKNAARWLGASYAAFCLGCLCKETAVVTPALLALCWVCDARPAPWRRAARLSAGFPVLAAAYLAWRFIALPLPGGIPAPHRADWMLSLGWYARMLLWPWPLCFEHAGLSGGLTAFAGLFVLAGAAVVFRPALLLGWAWMVLGLLPYLHIVPFAHTSPVADRYLYGAAAGFCLLLGQLLDRRGGRAVLAALCVVWGGLTFWRNVVFIDRTGICEQTGACAPDSAPAQILLGSSQLASGQYERARATFERAAAIDPFMTVAWSDLGIARYMLGDYDGSIAAFDKALAIKDSPEVRSNLETALAGKKKAATSAKAPRRRAKKGLP